MQAAINYIELAEAGISTAQLDAGLVLDKYKVFGETYYSKDLDKPVEMNSYLAFNFFKMALNSAETSDEAMMKLADYYYYGLPPVNTPQI